MFKELNACTEQNPSQRSQENEDPIKAKEDWLLTKGENKL